MPRTCSRHEAIRTRSKRWAKEPIHTSNLSTVLWTNKQSVSVAYHPITRAESQTEMGKSGIVYQRPSYAPYKKDTDPRSYCQIIQR